MTVTYGFYDSLAGDRKYNARQMSSLFDGLIKDGVFMSIGTAFAVSPSTGLNVSVGAGRAWFNHTWTNSDTALVIAVETPEAILKRIDTVVLEVDETESVRANTIKIIKGTPASVPVSPTLTNTALVHQYPLANISVLPGLTTFTTGHITNRIGTSDCPYVTGVVQSMTIDSIVAQWENSFNLWFDEMKDQLSTDAAGNLQVQITDLAARDEIFIKRKGGSATDWSVPGTNVYEPPKMTMQAGIHEHTAVGTSQVQQAYIAFPASFTAAPVVVAVLKDSGDSIFSHGEKCTLVVSSISANGFNVYMNAAPDESLFAAGYRVHICWQAVGPAA